MTHEPPTLMSLMNEFSDGWLSIHPNCNISNWIQEYCIRMCWKCCWSQEKWHAESAFVQKPRYWSQEAIGCIGHNLPLVNPCLIIFPKTIRVWPIRLLCWPFGLFVVGWIYFFWGCIWLLDFFSVTKHLLQIPLWIQLQIGLERKALAGHVLALPSIQIPCLDE